MSASSAASFIMFKNSTPICPPISSTSIFLPFSVPLPSKPNIVKPISFKLKAGDRADQPYVPGNTPPEFPGDHEAPPMEAPEVPKNPEIDIPNIPPELDNPRPNEAPNPVPDVPVPPPSKQPSKQPEVTPPTGPS